MLKELTGVTITQSALTQDALRRPVRTWELNINNCVRACGKLPSCTPTIPAGGVGGKRVTHHLRDRTWKDDDNQRLLNGLGVQDVA